jgi:hypothetical protein
MRAPSPFGATDFLSSHLWITFKVVMIFREHFWVRQSEPKRSIRLVISILFLFISTATSTATITPPRTSCFIRVDDPHLSESVRKQRGFDAVKVDAISICNRIIRNVNLTVEIKKQGFLRDYLVMKERVETTGSIEPHRRIGNYRTWARCLNGKLSNYYGIAYATAEIDGRFMRTKRVISSKVVALPCGT